MAKENIRPPTAQTRFQQRPDEIEIASGTLVGPQRDDRERRGTRAVPFVDAAAPEELYRGDRRVRRQRRGDRSDAVEMGRAEIFPDEDEARGEGRIGHASPWKVASSDASD